MKKLLPVIVCLALMAGALSGCGASVGKGNSNASGASASTSGVSGSISISGSSALYPLVNIAAAQFKKNNPNVAMNVAAGGSGTGLNNVLSGTVDIGNSDVYAEEKLSAGDASKLVDHKVCIIGVAIIVNADVGATVKNLTTDQLNGIFSGQITNWKSLGGPDETITVVNRPSSSGTRALFEKWGLGGQASQDTASLQTDDSNALLVTVGNTKGAAGYIALSYTGTAGPNISLVQVNGVDAAYDNIYNNKYQIWGYEHMYTNGQPNAQTKAFIDYMTSADMASQAETLGYGSTGKLNPDAAKSR